MAAILDLSTTFQSGKAISALLELKHSLLSWVEVGGAETYLTLFWSSLVKSNLKRQQKNLLL